MTFAKKLKSIRKQVGMSQELLAEKIGVSRQAVTKWCWNSRYRKYDIHLKPI